MDYDFTKVCHTDNSYIEGTHDIASSSVYCYEPVQVQIFYMIYFVFFAVMFILAVGLIRQLLKI